MSVIAAPDGKRDNREEFHPRVACHGGPLGEDIIGKHRPAADLQDGCREQQISAPVAGRSLEATLGVMNVLLSGDHRDDKVFTVPPT